MAQPLSALDVPALLQQYGLRPKKSLGQNFLLDPHALQKIVDAADVEPTDTVLEIGPGLGSLTRHLAARAGQVVAVELDQNLIPILRGVLAPFDNVQIIHGDILQFAPSSLISNLEYLVIANIPYYLTSALIRHLLESGVPPRRMTLTVQQEVAERLCASPPAMNLLALSVQVYGQPRLVARIPATAFYPPPKVDSAIVRVDLYPQPRLPRSHLGVFFRLIKAGFSQKRKTLRNALSGGLARPKEEVETLLRDSGIDPMRRAETLTLDEWGRLAACLDV